MSLTNQWFLSCQLFECFTIAKDRLCTKIADRRPPLNHTICSGRLLEIPTLPLQMAVASSTWFIHASYLNMRYPSKRYEARSKYQKGSKLWVSPKFHHLRSIFLHQSPWKAVHEGWSNPWRVVSITCSACSSSCPLCNHRSIRTALPCLRSEPPWSSLFCSCDVIYYWTVHFWFGGNCFLCQVQSQWTKKMTAVLAIVEFWKLAWHVTSSVKMEDVWYSFHY